LHTILGRSTPQGVLRFLEVELPQDSTLGDLLRRLEIELNPEAMLLVVNGRLAEVDDILKPGDRVNLMPAISGG
jgi:sulfur carrier protein ThiS